MHLSYGVTPIYDEPLGSEYANALPLKHFDKEGKEQEETDIAEGSRGAAAGGGEEPNEEPDAGRYLHRAKVQTWSSSSVCSFILVLGAAFILLWGALGLVLFWTVWYRKGFAWQEDPRKEFNLHPVLMVTGLVFFCGHVFIVAGATFWTFSGFDRKGAALLVYRTFQCSKRAYKKLLHTMLHLMALPCVVVGTIAVFDSHNLRSTPIPNLYTLHSWVGLIALGLFGLQFVVGFFSFLVLLCCDTSTESFRSALAPVHAAFGVITFWMSVAACLTGLLEKAIFALGDAYKRLPEEAVVINTLGVVLAALAILLPYILYNGHVGTPHQPPTVYKASKTPC